jgi:hypothetical protein
MSELDCRSLRGWMDENVGGATSWVEFSPRLAAEQQEHFSACLECRERCLQLLELERQLLSLREEPLPELDLAAGVMARIQRPAAVRPVPVSGFSLWAWAPLALLLVLLIPEPGVLPSWLAWSWALPTVDFEVPSLILPVDSGLALAAALPLAALATWKWRTLRHA